MAEKPDCIRLYLELSRIKERRAEFGRVYEEGLSKRDFRECRLLFREIRNLLDGPDTEIGRLRAVDLAPELEHLKLKEQYESQVEVARKSGLFGAKEVDKRGKGGKKTETKVSKTDVPVIERGGKKYPMPSWKEVRQTLRKPENREIIKEKSAQGFTKMLIVPFGYDLKTMAGKFKEKVKELDQEGINPDGSSNPERGIFGAGGEKVEFNKVIDEYPVRIWSEVDDSKCVYYPKIYDENNHGGMSKEEAIKLNGAWQICFVEDMPVIPEEGKEIGGRKQIDRKGSCIMKQTEIPRTKEYKEAIENRTGETGKKKMVNPAKYQHERGQTLEQYLWMQLTSLLGKERAILLDYSGNEKVGSIITECYYNIINDTPFTAWNSKWGFFELNGAGTNRKIVGETVDPFNNKTEPYSYGVRTVVSLK